MIFKRCEALDVPFEDDPLAQSLAADGGSDAATIAEAYGVSTTLIQLEVRRATRKFERIYRARYGEPDPEPHDPCWGSNVEVA